MKITIENDAKKKMIILLLLRLVAIIILMGISIGKIFVLSEKDIQDKTLTMAFMIVLGVAIFSGAFLMIASHLFYLQQEIIISKDGVHKKYPLLQEKYYSWDSFREKKMYVINSSLSGNKYGNQSYEKMLILSNRRQRINKNYILNNCELWGHINTIVLCINPISLKNDWTRLEIEEEALLRRLEAWNIKIEKD